MCICAYSAGQLWPRTIRSRHHGNGSDVNGVHLSSLPRFDGQLSQQMASLEAADVTVDTWATSSKDHFAGRGIVRGMNVALCLHFGT